MYQNNELFYLSLCLTKDYYNINPKTNRYIQLNITKNKIDLYEGHKKDYRKKFFDEYKEQLEYLCTYIKENKYYENINYISSNSGKKISLHADFLNFNLNINNDLKIKYSYQNIIKNNFNDNIEIHYEDPKISKKIKKENLTTEDILKKVLIKKEVIPLSILEEIELLNQVKVKKKTKNLPKNQ